MISPIRYVFFNYWKKSIKHGNTCFTGNFFYLDLNVLKKSDNQRVLLHVDGKYKLSMSVYGYVFV